VRFWGDVRRMLRPAPYRHCHRNDSRAVDALSLQRVRGPRPGVSTGDVASGDTAGRGGARPSGRMAAPLPAGSWSFWRDHAAPSQRQTRPASLTVLSTIVQAFVAEHETEGSCHATSPGCVTWGKAVQLAPFQVSATMSPTWSCPAATHASLETHETPDRLPSTALGWTVHAVPFQLSVTAEFVAVHPMATHAVAEVHDTAVRAPAPAVGTVVHVAPFHVAANRAPAPGKVVKSSAPTAVRPDRRAGSR
jgi:hypothetical protein